MLPNPLPLIPPTPEQIDGVTADRTYTVLMSQTQFK
jgi:hypothetical protein